MKLFGRKSKLEVIPLKEWDIVHSMDLSKINTSKGIIQHNPNLRSASILPPPPTRPRASDRIQFPSNPFPRNPYFVGSRYEVPPKESEEDLRSIAIKAIGIKNNTLCDLLKKAHDLMDDDNVRVALSAYCRWCEFKGYDSNGLKHSDDCILVKIRKEIEV